MFILGRVFLFFSFLVFTGGFPALVGVGCWWEGGFKSFSLLLLLAYGPYLYTLYVLCCAFFQVLLIYFAYLPIKKKRRESVVLEQTFTNWDFSLDMRTYYDIHHRHSLDD